MNLSTNLQQLLQWGVPKMHHQGQELFAKELEKAVRSVVESVFEPNELAAFNVTCMTDLPQPKGPSAS